MISKKSIVSVVLALTLSINFGIAAYASAISSSSTNVVLQKDQKEFTVNLSVNNDGKPYSGAEFGIKLNGVELVSTNFSVSDYSQAGPVTKDGVTYVGFFNTDNVYSEGKVCTLTLRYTGDTNASMVLAETQVSTRVNSNNIAGDKKNPNSEIKVTTADSNSGTDNGTNPSESNDSGNTSGNSSNSSSSKGSSSTGEFVASGNINTETTTGNASVSTSSSNNASTSSLVTTSNTSASSAQAGSSTGDNSSISASSNQNTVDSNSKENASQKSKEDSKNASNNVTAWEIAVAILSVLLAALGGIIIWQYGIIKKLKNKN